MSNNKQYNLESVLGDLSEEIDASCLFVMTPSGIIVGHCGRMPAIEINTLGALVWGMYSAAEKIHDLLGDNEMPALSHYTSAQNFFVFGMSGAAGVLSVVGKMSFLSPPQIDAIKKASLQLNELIPSEYSNWDENLISKAPGSHRSDERLNDQSLNQGLEEESDLFELESDIFHSDK